MPQDNRPFVLRVLLVICFATIAGVCTSFYNSTNHYALVSTSSNSSQPILTDPEVLQNWLPAASYTYTLNHLNSYLAANNVSVNSMTAQDEVQSGAGVYNFNVTTVPASTPISLSVTVANLEGLISTAVTINGTLQDTTVPSTLPSSNGNSTTFSGTDALITEGATVSQINALEQAFQKFKLDAITVTIDTSRINSALGQSDNTVTYQFPVNIDGTIYGASFICIGSDQAQLKLVDQQTNRAVFDSGALTGQS